MNARVPPSWAMPASKLERVRVLVKEEEHGQRLSRKSGWADPQRTLPFERKGNVQNRLNLLLRKSISLI